MQQCRAARGAVEGTTVRSPWVGAKGPVATADPVDLVSKGVGGLRLPLWAATVLEGLSRHCGWGPVVVPEAFYAQVVAGTPREAVSVDSRSARGSGVTLDVWHL
jgi:hypothetical protein